MTQFVKSQFTTGEYLMYNGQFVARFKHCPRNRAGFISFLIKHFTVEEYFAARDAGETPARILETKGYVSTTAKRILKDAGYPETLDGLSAYVAAQAHGTARTPL